ncbi:hypothetical protein PWG71_08940 [Nocardiopsis sp. N85]|uniref:hypothetical protein n=1 Tax=Nocardiopsis sp. N85 TaxID=3029400 RepID=UPI00237FA862|nr:hypothetical protein [Nocardiopsis sp. N85]MDE3721512.1 hypothetical protein [Nocardiopsis sp. N85]
MAAPVHGGEGRPGPAAPVSSAAMSAHEASAGGPHDESAEAGVEAPVAGAWSASGVEVLLGGGRPVPRALVAGAAKIVARAFYLRKLLAFAS